MTLLFLTFSRNEKEVEKRKFCVGDDATFFNVSFWNLINLLPFQWKCFFWISKKLTKLSSRAHQLLENASSHPKCIFIIRQARAGIGSEANRTKCRLKCQHLFAYPIRKWLFFTLFIHLLAPFVCSLAAHSTAIKKSVMQCQRKVTMAWWQIVSLTFCFKIPIANANSPFHTQFNRNKQKSM